MNTTTILLTLSCCLFAITSAFQQDSNLPEPSSQHTKRQWQQPSCPSYSQCYSIYAGLYYLTIKNGNYTWHMLLTLRVDSSTSWTGNDQSGDEQLQLTSPFYQPYSSSNGRWGCDSNENAKVQIVDYGFILATAKLPTSSFVYNTKLHLNISNLRLIKGAFQYRAYNLNTTHLDETTRGDNRYLHLDRDQAGDAVYSTITGYKIARFC